MLLKTINHITIRSAFLGNTVCKYGFGNGEQKQKVVLFPGNGIGPEISQSVIDIFKSLSVPI